MKAKNGTGSKDHIFARLLRDSKAGNEQAKEVMEKVMRKEITHNKASIRSLLYSP